MEEPATERALWLAVQLPLLGFEAHPAWTPEQPAALIENGRVAQADAGALQAGVRIGVTATTAHGIAPEVAHLQRDEQAERECLERAGLVGYRFSSRVSQAPPAGLVIDMRGSLQLFGGLAALAEQLANAFRGLGHGVETAAAPTPLAALLLARAGLPGLPGDVWAALRRVPLHLADFPAAELERLNNMGFRNFGAPLDLLAESASERRSGGEPLPPHADELGWQELGKRFSPQLIDFLSRLTGRKADPRSFIEPPEKFASTLHLLAAVEDLNELRLPMRRLAVRLGRWLAARRFGTALLRWEFKPLREEHEAEREAGFDVRFAVPTRDVASFLALSQLRLARAELPEEVMSITLRAGLTTPFEPPTPDLLTARGVRSELASRAELVDLLAARLGDDALWTVRTVDDPRPEHAWRPVSAVDQSARAAHPRTAAKAQVGNHRPLWLLAFPQPVAVADFNLLAGPERIETGWWDAASGKTEEDAAGNTEGDAENAAGKSRLKERRDYFVAVSKSGAQCWLYRSLRRSAQKTADRSARPAPEEWFLHGYFA